MNHDVAWGLRLAVGLTALSVAGCEGTFRTANVSLDYESGEVRVRLIPNEEPPCPELGYDESEIAVDGMPLVIQARGGEAGDSDGIRYGYCEDAEALGNVARFGGPMRVEVVSGRSPIEVSGVVPDAFEIWSDDDLSAAVAEGTEFVVRWTPESADPPRLSLRIGSDDPEVSITRTAVGDGSATYLIEGAPAAERYVIQASTRFEAETTCTGVEACSIWSSRSVELGPR